MNKKNNLLINFVNNIQNFLIYCFLIYSILIISETKKNMRKR